ncbi:glycerophosphodiester phosphodiesterase [Pseudoclavibacter alba]|uniref:glycerophosphodiester phosphodiesterase family protein n=1 Tax=Pseudoclavibacter albus TaxID=272241 RepID=UPI0019D232A5|nr:glycerophosphodiester phosphodiesterase family protein [Pseudoclavibacter alba]MBN6777290.1 glycerophosphodiester phosphodiesterase [Pseudoclavibacter alba]
MLREGHGRPILIGHRGAPCYRPEHSAVGYRMALAQGCDALETDLVPSSDGALVIRHEEALSGSTDVAQRPEFASRRRRKIVEDIELVDWFAEDFTWSELETLRCREPLPDLRPKSARFDDRFPLMRLDHLLRLVEADRDERGGAVLVLELKTPSLFAAQGLDSSDLLVRKLQYLGDSELLDGLVIESFDHHALRELRWRGLSANLVPLFEPDCSAGQHLDDRALDDLTHWADGLSVASSMLGVRTTDDLDGAASGAELVSRAHDRGLAVLSYTLRPEDRYLPEAFAGDPERYWRGLLATGIDGVFVDAPDLVSPLLDDFASPERAEMFRWWPRASSARAS